LNIFSEYNAKVFELLPDFRTAKHSLHMNKECLKELGMVICRHGLQEHVGVSLLHRHFYLSPDERLVKDFIGNEAYIKPSKQNNIEVVPYLWQFDQGQNLEDASYNPLEFVIISSRTNRAKTDAETVCNAKAFLLEMSNKIHELSLEHIFGITTLYGTNEITLNDNEILLETTDHINRLLKLSPTSKSDFTITKDTETAWQFSSVLERDTLLNCTSCCTNHCTNHPPGP